jgi:hypothetical protein
MSETQHTWSRLGLVLGAALLSLALLSVAASSASAKEQRGFFLAGEKSEEAAKKPRFEGELNPTYLATEKSSTYKFGFKSGNLTCSGVFSGKLGSASPEVAVTSVYVPASCVGPLFQPITILAHMCENTLSALNQGPPYVGQWGYKCPAGSSYEFVEGNFETGCRYVIPAQTGLNGVELKNTGTAKTRGVGATLNVTGLKYSIKGPGFCQPGEYTTGTISGSMTLLGYNE